MLKLVTKVYLFVYFLLLRLNTKAQIYSQQSKASICSTNQNTQLRYLILTPGFYFYKLSFFYVLCLSLYLRKSFFTTGNILCLLSLIPYPFYPFLYLLSCLLFLALWSFWGEGISFVLITLYWKAWAYTFPFTKNKEITRRLNKTDERISWIKFEMKKKHSIETSFVKNSLSL